LIYAERHPVATRPETAGSPMRIAKPMLLIATPLGILCGLYEAWRLAGGLVFLMVALLSMMSVAASMVVLTIRKEQRTGRLP
jgi:hypothetical protein